ncbi:MAG: DUF4296 domain-containing protein [Gelidibacter sp.]
MKHFFYILILISFVSCNSVDRPEKPKNLIAEDKMSEIMYDLYILNAAKGVNRKLLELNGIMPSEYIYKKYDIDSLQFAESNTYYSYDTEVYSSIIQKMSGALEKDKAFYEKLAKEDLKVKDSI